MKVMEIFRSLQGEGMYTGCPTTFVRFAGCRVGCPGCDTVPSWKSKNKLGDKETVTSNDIIEVMKEIDSQPQHICITGGEPLEQDQDKLLDFIHKCMEVFSHNLRSITIETSGAYDYRYINEKVQRGYAGNIHFNFCWSMDWKPPTTKVMHKMVLDNFLYLRTSDIIKIVCGNERDFRAAIEFLQRIIQEGNPHTTVYFNAMGGRPETWLSSLILGHDFKWAQKNFDIRYGVQLHKLLELR